MFHHVAKAAPHSLLFRTWSEGLTLWHAILSAAPGPIALCIMPCHLHAMYRRDVRTELRIAMGAYARRRNAARGESGRVWQSMPAPTNPLGKLKRWRDEKYIHKNPCRARLVDAPLAWPLSTYADACGLTLAPVRQRVADPVRYHEQTCRDDHVTSRPLPIGDGDRWGQAGPLQVRDAVSRLLRVPESALLRRGAPRTLFVGVARALTDATLPELGALCGMSQRSLVRTGPRHDAASALVARVLGDPRFTPLHDGDLLRDPRWREYCHRRRITR